MRFSNIFIQTERQETLYQMAGEIAEEVKQYKKQGDQEATLPIEALEALKQSHYLSLTLPKAYNGEDISLYEFLLIQERLAEGDGAVALSIGWHLSAIKQIFEENQWEQEKIDFLAREISEKQKLINRCNTEPATGSPTRGGMPETKAVKDGDHYLVSGRKNFATMAAVLDYYIINVYVEDKEAVGSILIPRELDGIDVEKTWDTLGMRGTGSDDLVFDQVRVPKENIVELYDKPQRPTPNGWLLHIPACYLGIAMAARNEAIEFAKSFQPNSLNKPIAEVEHIQTKIGEMELKLLQARHLMYSVAEKWDSFSERRHEIMRDLGAVKLVATNSANEIVDLAMRIAGGRGLSKQLPFEQLYRDVRAGLHNPPMDDMVISMLAKNALS
ncbi:acyl-CoA dehydrogenase family protein [Gracilibacillus alcaliphilus]|uniref:acyl-CoA dehydrogenase family protein n=1 Tax=Gracilibacillus alcaliphilus TaxID=1401441 RepID=UPI001959D817|nr:acyl-CoA dehydrogenase family protein [Gracilibacillus alcaliphilus]MBM7675932.1 alkylation response protein AidB-like acyl-CoA dehydrogenase [Gracilibacillus alcaliphilus]